MDFKIDFEESEEPIQAYGSTGTNQLNAGKTGSEDTAEIPLSDSKSVNFRGTMNTQAKSYVASNEAKAPSRPPSHHSLLNSSRNYDRQSICSDSSFQQNESWIHHPKVRENWRIVLASGFLAVLGLALIITSVALAFTPTRGYHCLIIGIIGLLCVIPGGYHFVYIYCAALGRPGYHFENLPVLR